MPSSQTNGCRWGWRGSGHQPPGRTGSASLNWCPVSLLLSLTWPFCCALVEALEMHAHGPQEEGLLPCTWRSAAPYWSPSLFPPPPYATQARCIGKLQWEIQAYWYGRVGVDGDFGNIEILGCQLELALAMPGLRLLCHVHMLHGWAGAFHMTTNCLRLGRSQPEPHDLGCQWTGSLARRVGLVELRQREALSLVGHLCRHQLCADLHVPQALILWAQ